MAFVWTVENVCAEMEKLVPAGVQVSGDMDRVCKVCLNHIHPKEDGNTPMLRVAEIDALGMDDFPDVKNLLRTEKRIGWRVTESADKVFLIEATQTQAPFCGCWIFSNNKPWVCYVGTVGEKLFDETRAVAYIEAPWYAKARQLQAFGYSARVGDRISPVNLMAKLFGVKTVMLSGSQLYDLEIESKHTLTDEALTIEPPPYAALVPDKDGLGLRLYTYTAKSVRDRMFSVLKKHFPKEMDLPLKDSECWFSVENVDRDPLAAEGQFPADFATTKRSYFVEDDFTMKVSREKPAKLSLTDYGFFGALDGLRSAHPYILLADWQCAGLTCDAEMSDIGLLEHLRKNPAEKDSVYGFCASAERAATIRMVRVYYNIHAKTDQRAVEYFSDHFAQVTVYDIENWTAPKNRPVWKRDVHSILPPPYDLPSDAKKLQASIVHDRGAISVLAYPMPPAADDTRATLAKCEIAVVDEFPVTRAAYREFAVANPITPQKIEEVLNGLTRGLKTPGKAVAKMIDGAVLLRVIDEGSYHHRTVEEVSKLLSSWMASGELDLTKHAVFSKVFLDSEPEESLRNYMIAVEERMQHRKMFFKSASREEGAPGVMVTVFVGWTKQNAFLRAMPVLTFATTAAVKLGMGVVVPFTIDETDVNGVVVSAEHTSFPKDAVAAAIETLGNPRLMLAQFDEQAKTVTLYANQPAVGEPQMAVVQRKTASGLFACGNCENTFVMPFHGHCSACGMLNCGPSPAKPVENHTHFYGELPCGHVNVFGPTGRYCFECGSHTGH